jgi:hypothetical protein
MHPLHARQELLLPLEYSFKKEIWGLNLKNQSQSISKTTCPNRSIYKTTVAKQQMAFSLHRIHFTGR